MKKLFTALTMGLLVIAMAGEADAKSKSAKRANYSKVQQKAFFDEAMKVCRKKYRASLHNVEVDYVHRRYICYIY
jgi:hypothetical protein